MFLKFLVYIFELPSRKIFPFFIYTSSAYFSAFLIRKKVIMCIYFNLYQTVSENIRKIFSRRPLYICHDDFPNEFLKDVSPSVLICLLSASVLIMLPDGVGQEGPGSQKSHLVERRPVPQFVSRHCMW